MYYWSAKQQLPISKTVGGVILNMGTLLAAARPTDRFKSGYKSKNLV